MKRVLCLFLILPFAGTLFSQQLNPPSGSTKQDYLKRSRKEKTTGWILSGQGVLFVSMGLIDPKFLHNDPGEPGVRGLTIVGGLVSIFGGVILFIGAAKDRKQVVSLLLKHETVPQVYKPGFVSTTISSLALKVSL